MNDRAERLIGGRFRFASRTEPERSSGRVFSFTDGSLTATVEIGVVKGNWEPVGFDVRTYLHDQQGSARGRLLVRPLREVPFGALVDEALLLLRQDFEKDQLVVGPEAWTDDDGHHRVSISAVAVNRGVARLNGPGRPTLTFEQLEEAARFHNARARVSRHPTRDLAEHLHLSPSGASKRVARARAAGLIPAYQRRETS